MPQVKLSDKTIDAIGAPHPDGRQTLYWDTTMKGLGVLVSGTSNVKTFVAKGRVNGKTVRKKLGRVGVMTLTEAKQSAREIFRDLGAGVDPRKPKTAAMTLSEACDAYLAAHDLGARTKVGYADIVKRYFPDWADMPLRDVTRDMVEQRHLAIAKEVAHRHTVLADSHFKLHLTRAEKVEVSWPEASAEHRARAAAAQVRKVHSGKATANNAMRTLRALHNYAADKNPNFPPNPVKLKRQWNKVPRRERIVANDDMPKFYRAIMELESPIGRDYLLLILFTGLRRREATALKWSEVDLVGKTLTIPAIRNKSGRKLDLPLTDYVYDMLVARRSIGRTEYVFTAASKSGHLEEPKHFLAQVAVACGVKVSVHDLRRTFITVAESCDISPVALRALVNHSVGNDVTSGYIIMNSDRLREPAQRVTDRIKLLCQVASN